MTTTDSRSAQWLKSNLAAIGSAAVLTVYATGWTRTKAAADLLEEQSARRLPPRRPAARVAMGQIDGTRMPRAAASNDAPMLEHDAEPSTAPTPATSQAGASESAPQHAEANEASPSPDVAPSNSKPAVAAPTTSAPPTASSAVSPASVAPANTVANGGPSNAVLAASVVSTVLPPTEVAARGVASSPAPVVKAAQLPPQTPAVAVPNSSDTRPPERELATTAIATVPASAGAAKADPNAPVRYKDGVYSGWGSSRHGDIEAYVEIKNGHIKSTFISECLTQYSCSWIAKLPGWVVEAQSAETDYISGATQSSNAFYYAVVAALNKAR